MKGRYFVLVILAFLFIAGCGRKERVVVAIAPLTGEGAVYGKPQVEAAQMAVDEINAAGGLLGEQIKLIPYDDKKDPKEAVNIAQQVITNDNVVSVIGHPNSATAMAASKVYHQHKYPFIISSATNPKITEQGFDNVFRFVPTDVMQGKSIALFAKNTLGKNKLWIVYSNMEYGKGLAESIRESFAALGGEIKFFDAVQPNAPDYKTILSKLKTLRPDLIAFPAMLPEAAKFIRQMKELKLEAFVLLGDGAFDEQLVSLSSANCANVAVSFMAPPWETLPNAARFVAAFKQKYGSVPPFAPYGYEAMSVLAAAVRKAGSLDREKVLAALRSPDFAVDGITGGIAFDQQGQAKDRLFYFYRFDGKGKLVPY
jgi:ABC-type branched-subunit amino acid transport system substrate-binding protein